jgi:Rrf2 family iron-sulfur cluster assembly transcriptional regulator
MHVTMRTEYALLALTIIMDTGKGKPITRKKIAESHFLSQHFLEKVLLSLQRGDLVESRRGPGGGFVLARPPEGITLWDVYQAVDEPDFKVERCHPALDGCDLWDGCKVKRVWFEFHRTLRDTMSKITLADVGD